MDFTADPTASAFTARRVRRLAQADADSGDLVLPLGLLERIDADSPVVRDDVVADVRDRMARVEHPSAEELADSLMRDLVTSRNL